MTERGYLDDKLARIDPDFQLTVAFARADHRDALCAVYALRAEFRDLLVSARDSGVALAKLGWWQEECLRWTEGGPRHPVTRALHELELTAAQGLTESLGTLAGLIEGEAGASVEDWWALADRLGRPFADLEARGQRLDDDLGGQWQQIQFTALVLDLPRLWQSGRALVPLDLAARLQIDRSRLVTEPATGMPVLRALAEQPPPAPADTRAHAGVYRSLCSARLQALVRTRWSQGGLTGQPGAVKRLWVAWRAARKQRRLDP